MARAISPRIDRYSYQSITTFIYKALELINRYNVAVEVDWYRDQVETGFMIVDDALNCVAGLCNDGICRTEVDKARAPRKGRTDMASDREFVTYVCEQLRSAGEISSRCMFGEAAIYLQNRVVGLVCDNQLFLKATEPGRAKIGVPIESPPFPGASNWFLMADLDDPEFLAEVVRATADALPAPKVKAKKTLRRKSKPAGRKKVANGPDRGS